MKPLWVMGCLLLVSGCGEMASESVNRPAFKSSADESYSTSEVSATTAEHQIMAGTANISPEDESAGAAVNAEPIKRRVIYSAQIHLVVDSLDVTESAIKKLVDNHGGYVANFSEDRSYGELRAAQWTLRIPVEGFNEVLDRVADLGVPENRAVDSQDVSEQFVDLQARLKNQRRLEDELADILAKRDGNLEGVLAMKHELSSVREEIERIEGRLRFLSDCVELTTITVYAREDRDYQPQQAPTFTARIGNSWNQSLASLQTTGENLAVAVVAIAPWLGVLSIIIATPTLLLWRRVRSNRQAHRSL